MPELLYSFIFVNYRSADLLEKALASLVGPLSGLSYEFILVNNDVSESARIEVLGKRYGAVMKLLPANYGFGKAANLGAAEAKGEVLFFLNPDAEFQKGNLLSLWGALEFFPKGIFGMLLKTASGRDEPWSSGDLPTLWRLFSGKFFRSKPMGTRVMRAGWVSGAALALRKEVFLSLGGFDESFFLYYEDVDLCARAEKNSFPVFSYPFLVFRHAGGESHVSHKSMKRAYFESQKKYFSKHGTQTEKTILSFLQPLYQKFFS
ncbi:MAG: glycosyltransferase family 2 protein [Candidatus Moraniibacteriota bacterium]